MPLHPNFLQPDLKPLYHSTKRLAIGIALGLCSAFVFYCLFYAGREAMRVMTITDYYDLWRLTEVQVWFYNFFFALIALIFGQSIAIEYLLYQPNKRLFRNSYRRMSILVDQRFLNWNFLFFFVVKMGTIYGLAFSYPYYGGWEHFLLSPDYWYLFVLIVVALFLQTWTSIRLNYKRWSLKWMLTSAFIIIILALGLSFVDIVDYKAINQSVLKHNTTYRYQIDIPFSEVYEGAGRRSLASYIDVAYRQGDTTFQQPIILVEGKETTLEELKNTLIREQDKVTGTFRSLIYAKLNIHKQVPMHYVNLVHTELSKAFLGKLEYGVIPAGYSSKNAKYAYHDFVLRTMNPVADSTAPWFLSREETKREISKGKHIISLSHHPIKGYSINKKFVTKKLISTEIAELVPSSERFIFYLEVNPKTNFEDYIFLKAVMKKTTKEFYDKQAKNEFGKSYMELKYENKKAIRKAYAVLVFELEAEK